jgi:hypothetical protein
MSDKCRQQLTTFYCWYILTPESRIREFGHEYLTRNNKHRTFSKDGNESKPLGECFSGSTPFGLFLLHRFR